MKSCSSSKRDSGIVRAWRRGEFSEHSLQTGNVPYKGKLQRLGCWVFNQVNTSAADLHYLTPFAANLAAEGTPVLKQVMG